MLAFSEESVSNHSKGYMAALVAATHCHNRNLSKAKPNTGSNSKPESRGILRARLVINYKNVLT